MNDNDKKEYFKNYYIENKEHLLELMKLWQKKNYEKQKEYRRMYYKEYRKRKKIENDESKQNSNNNLSGPNV